MNKFGIIFSLFSLLVNKPIFCHYTLVQDFKAHTKTLTSLKFKSFSKDIVLASASYDGKTKIWKKKKPYTFNGFGNGFNNVSFIQ